LQKEGNNLPEYEQFQAGDKNGHQGEPKPVPVISIPQGAYESWLGHRFAGQTGFLTFGYEHYAWGALVNPADSGVDLFIDTFTLSNFTDIPFVGKVWLNTTLTCGAFVSTDVSACDTALRPLPIPKGQILYSSHRNEQTPGGVNPFLRIAEPYSTLVADQDGAYVIPPGGNFAIALRAIDRCNKQLTAKIVFAWWEEKTKRPPCSL
jgi:hypothetical protein